MGAVFLEEKQSWEKVNWYMNIVKCNNNTSDVTCKPMEEINSWIEDNLYLYRRVEYPMLDVNYLN